MKDEKGFILIASCFLMIFILLISTVMVQLTIREAKLATKQSISQQSFYVADGGIEKSISLIKKGDITYPYNEITQLVNGTYDITINNPSDEDYIITSTGYSNTQGRRSIEVSINRILNPAEIFKYAVGSGGDLLISGNAIVNSTPNPGEGNIYSGGNVTVQENAIINGGVDSVGTISILDSGSITGDQNVGTDSLPLVDIDSDLYITQAQTGGTYFGTYTLNGSGPAYLGPLYIDGDLVIEGQQAVELSGTVYVTGTISITGNGTLNGDHTIVSVGDITFQGTSTGQVPLVMSVNGNIDASGNTDYDAFLYAPNGSITVSGSGTITGGVTGQSVTLSGNGNVTHDQNIYQNYDLPIDPKLTEIEMLSWQEVIN